MTDLSFKKALRKRTLTLCGVIVFVVTITLAGIITLEVTRTPTPTTEHLYVKNRNILFIVVDDLRPSLGCYRDPIAITPNIDALANQGIIFKNAHAQQALCAPSRTSFLTSRRPDTLRLYNVGSYWRHSVGNFTTLPQYFKEHGYHTHSIGKIFHPGKVSDHDDKKYSWSQDPYHPSTEDYKNASVCGEGKDKMNIVCPVDVAEQPEGTLPDLQCTEVAIDFIQEQATHKEHDKPFFLALGLQKPHIPLKFPKEYLALYPTMDIVSNPNKTVNFPDIAWNPWQDLRRRDDVDSLNVSFPFGPLPVDYQKQVRRAYYASVSYIDGLIGRVLEALEVNGYSDNTTIVLLGDHGWSLGEHQEWSKYSNLEVATRVPLIVYIPHVTEKVEDHQPFEHIDPTKVVKKTQPYANHGPSVTTKEIRVDLIADEFVELVDIFPTLVDVSALPSLSHCTKTNSTSSDNCTEGKSLKNLISGIRDKSDVVMTSKESFSQYPRPSEQPQVDSDQPKQKDINYMGYSVINKHFHYIEWHPYDIVTFKPNWDSTVAFEFYNRSSDRAENINIYEEVIQKQPNVIKELSSKLRERFI